VGVTSDPAMVGLVNSTIEKNRVKISEVEGTNSQFFRRAVHRFADYRIGLFLVMFAWQRLRAEQDSGCWQISPKKHFW